MDRIVIKYIYKNSYVIKNFRDNFVVFFFFCDCVDVINFFVILFLLLVMVVVKFVLKKLMGKILLDFLLLNFNV